MKTTALQKTINIVRGMGPYNLSCNQRLQLTEEAHDELQVLVDEAAWANAAEEEIARLKAEITAKEME